MVFVSYSHADEKWHERFILMAKPLKRFTDINVWSDKQIAAGNNWRNEIDKALNTATIAILLVSDSFLASDFIMDYELPRLLSARREGKVTVFWVPLTPCQYKMTGLSDIQAVTNPRRPLSAMTEFEFKSVLCDTCEEIDKLLKLKETPQINLSLNKKRVSQKQTLEVLKSPAARETTVLVYSPDGRWYNQGHIPKGGKTLICHFGSPKTPPETEFKLVAITTATRFSETRIDNLPTFRSISKPVTVALQ
jgi:hypothetical protein